MSTKEVDLKQGLEGGTVSFELSKTLQELISCPKKRTQLFSHRDGLEFLELLDLLKSDVDMKHLMQVFLASNSRRRNALMIASSRQADLVIALLKFIDKHHNYFEVSDVVKLLTDVDENGNNALMIAAVNQELAASMLIDIMHKYYHMVEPRVWAMIIEAKNLKGWNALMLASWHNPQVALKLLSFMEQHYESLAIASLASIVNKKNGQGDNSLLLSVSGTSLAHNELSLELLSFIQKHLKNNQQDLDVSELISDCEWYMRKILLSCIGSPDVALNLLSTISDENLRFDFVKKKVKHHNISLLTIAMDDEAFKNNILNKFTPVKKKQIVQLIAMQKVLTKYLAKDNAVENNHILNPKEFCESCFELDCPKEQFLAIIKYLRDDEMPGTHHLFKSMLLHELLNSTSSIVDFMKKYNANLRIFTLDNKQLLID
jgi:hypothetical protein